MTAPAVIGVPVATVWSSPDAPRPEDALALGPDPDVPAWTASLDHELRLGLLGRVVTQALWGDPVIVLDERDGWAHVVLPGQPSAQAGAGYPGWIPAVQVCAGEEIPDPEFSVVIATRTVRGTVAGTQRPVQVSFGTRLRLPDRSAEPPPGGGETWAYTRSGHRLRLPAAALAPAPGGTAPGSTAGAGATGPAIAQSALGFAGLAYLWGGASGFGLDCSGLAWIAHRRHGIVVPRDSGDQAGSGQPVSLDALERGDLVFFAEHTGGRIHHVGIALGRDRMVHSPRTGRAVEVMPLAAEPYASELASARRYR
jgi:gamma-D-glutamyl-L-lysine dipeptidyl-peptidase